MEGEPASLECEVNKPNMAAQWFKDDVPIKDGGRYKMVVDGCQHVLEIEEVEYNDEADYTIKIADKTSMATLMVDGKS